MTKDNRVTSDYLHKALDVKLITETLRKGSKTLREDCPQFDAIAFTGVSGALIAPTLAARLKKGLLVVRKHSEKRHSLLDIEGMLGAKRYIIVDDFVSSGRTVGQVIARIESKCPGAKLVGIYQYRGGILTVGDNLYATRTMMDRHVWRVWVEHAGPKFKAMADDVVVKMDEKMGPRRRKESKS